MNVSSYGRCKSLLLQIFFIGIICLTVTPLYAAQATLQWDTVQPPPDGYHVYQRKADATYNYNAPAWTGNTANCTINNLQEGTTYYFVVRAYQETEESGDSNEIDYTPSVTIPVDVDHDGYTEAQGDCNDQNASVHPGASEICGDGVDQNCDGRDLTCPEDLDDDKDGYTENQGDCNDLNASVHPGASEICGDGVDQNCDGRDLACPEDLDDDKDGYTENQGDCNDRNASIHPGASEICGDGVDQNCDGRDLTCPEDLDDDRDGYTENQGDCNDLNAAVHPNAAEICGDGIDQDCNGSDATCDEDLAGQTVVFGNTPDADFPGTVRDTFINLNTQVNAASNRLNAYTWPDNTPANAVLIKIDLSQLPAGAQIESAILTLYQTEAGGDASYDVSAHPVINHNPDVQTATGYTYDGTANWSASSACYNDIPLAQSDIAPAEYTNALDRTAGYKDWEITAMVQGWVNNPTTNYGLLLNADSVAASNSYRNFASSEESDTQLRPTLEITFAGGQAPQRLSQANWQLLYADSEELAGEDGAAENAFDGDPSTIWHTAWLNGSPAPPHEIQIDLGAAYDISGFAYLPRQDDGVNGTIGQYELFISNNPAEWGAPVSSGTFVNTSLEQEVDFSSVTGRYIRLRALTEVNNNAWTSVSEINVIGSPATVNTPPSGNTGPLEQTLWQLLYTDSEELVGEDGAAENAFDGDPSTIWHTAWLNGSPAPPHEIQIDLGATHIIDGFRYLPRQDNGINGRIGQYEFYVSNDPRAWGSPAASGAFPNTDIEQEVTISRRSGRYVRLRAITEANGAAWTSVAEFNVLGE